MSNFWLKNFLKFVILQKNWHTALLPYSTPLPYSTLLSSWIFSTTLNLLYCPESFTYPGTFELFNMPEKYVLRENYTLSKKFLALQPLKKSCSLKTSINKESISIQVNQYKETEKAEGRSYQSGKTKIKIKRRKNGVQPDAKSKCRNPSGTSGWP